MERHVRAKGTPDATIKKLTRDFKAVLADPDVRRKLGEAGFEIVASDGPRWMPM